MEGSEDDFTSRGAGGGLTSKSLSGLDAYDSLQFSVLEDIENKKSSDNGSGLCSVPPFCFRTSAILNRSGGVGMEWGDKTRQMNDCSKQVTETKTGFSVCDDYGDLHTFKIQTQ